MCGQVTTSSSPTGVPAVEPARDNRPALQVPPAPEVSAPDLPPPAQTGSFDLSALSEAIARQIHACHSDPTSGGDAEKPQGSSAEPPSAVERRRAHRYPVGSPRSKAILKLGKTRVEAEVLDESNAGAALLVDGEAPCELGQTALLKIASSWAEVRVVNMRRESIPDEHAEGANKCRMRLGLARIKDVEEPEDEVELAESISWAEVRSLFEPFAPLAKPAIGVAVFLLLALIVAVSINWLLDDPSMVADATTGAMRSGSPGLARVDPPEAEESVDDAPAPLSRKDDHRPRVARRRVAPPADESEPGAAAPSAPASETSAPSRVEVPSPPPPRPSLVLHPRSIERLGLSSEQLDRLHAILDETGEVIDETFVARLKSVSRSAPVTWTERTAERVLQVLNDEQKSIMSELLDDPTFAQRDAAAVPESTGESANSK